MGLFKGKINVQKTIDTAASGIDKLFFTNEEKADVSKGIADAQLEYLKSTVDENSTRSITRRYLSLAIVFVFLVLIIAAVVIRGFDKDYAQFVFETAKELNTLVLMVAGFFFGGYMISTKVIDKLKNRKKDGKK